MVATNRVPRPFTANLNIRLQPPTGQISMASTGVDLARRECGNRQQNLCVSMHITLKICKRVGAVIEMC